MCPINLDFWAHCVSQLSCRNLLFFINVSLIYLTQPMSNLGKSV